MTTIADLQALGFETGIAQGSIQVEQDALTAAQAAADPTVVADQVNTITVDTVQMLSNLGRLPETPDERLELATQIGAAALAGLTEAVTEKVAFHQRALAIAQAMPDVWAVRQLAGGTMIVQTYVSCKADGTGWDPAAQAHLDALADKPAYAEREYQALNPDAMQAAQTLTRLGRDIQRPKPGKDVFLVDGATHAGADLPALAESAAASPPPTTSEKIVSALDGSASLDAATKQALQAAVTG